MNIALVTCDNLPDWEMDDTPLVKALGTMEAIVHQPSWTDDIDWEQFDISVIRTTWDYHLRNNEFLSWCKQVPRLFNNFNIVRWNAHKSYLHELEENGTAIAPTVWIDAHEKVDIQQLVGPLGTSRGFIKPQVGACASDTLRFSIDEIEQAQQFLDVNLYQDMMVQPYLDSVETEGELSAIFIDGEFTHGVQKIPVKGDYRVQDDFGAKDMPYCFTNEEIKTMKLTLSAVPNNDSLLYARFDYLRDNSGKLVLNELELVEPSLFFRHCPLSADKFATAIIKRV